MSEQEEQGEEQTEEPQVKEPEEKKEPTATQLFASYMRSIAKVKALSKQLGAETETALTLAKQLRDRFGIQVSGIQPSKAKAARPQYPPLMNAGEDGSEKEFEPPVQMHSNAVALSGAGSQEVEDIRRDAGLDVPAEDSEALGTEGIAMMEQLQAGMTGTPAVTAQPGEHQAGTPVERSNVEGGPVRQGPAPEGE